MLDSARYALERIGITDQTEEQLHMLIGPPLGHAFRDYYGLDTTTVESAVSYFREHLTGKGIQRYEAYPGITDLLRDLVAAGIEVAVVTSKLDTIAAEALKSTNLHDYFSVICAQKPGLVVEKQEILKDALIKTDTLQAKSSVVMVGDRKHDVEAAKAMSVDSIGVLWGYGSRTELENEGATQIAASDAELRTLLLSA